QLRQLKTTRQQVLGQRVPACGGESTTEVVSDITVETTFPQKLPRRTCRLTAQLLDVERLCRLVRFDESCSPTAVTFRSRTVATDIRQLQPRTIGQPFHRFDETQVFDLHDEPDDIAALPAPETVEGAVPGSHIERRRLLVVERTQTFQCIATRRPECH